MALSMGALVQNRHAARAVKAMALVDRGVVSPAATKVTTLVVCTATVSLAAVVSAIAVGRPLEEKGLRRETKEAVSRRL